MAPAGDIAAVRFSAPSFPARSSTAPLGLMSVIDLAKREGGPDRGPAGRAPICTQGFDWIVSCIGDEDHCRTGF
jgi:hypothetical protein